MTDRNTPALPLLDQFALVRQHPWPAAFGACFGGFPPSTAFLLTHHQYVAGKMLFGLVPVSWACIPVAIACLLYSVQTVWDWGMGAFDLKFKTACLIIALEGAMVAAPIQWLSGVALVLLIVLNAVATACTLVSKRSHQPDTSAAVARERERALPRAEVERVAARRLARSPA